MEPKCGPIAGNNSLQIKINIGKIEQKYLFSLTVGFKASNAPIELNERFKGKYKSNRESNSEDNREISDSQNLNQNQNLNQPTIQSNLKEGQIINPKDIDNLDSQLDQPNWICCFATYDSDNHLLTCDIPRI